MKYRNLTEEELAPLEKEFIDFLVVNGIDHTTWDKKLKHDQEVYSQMISAFSDVVFEKIIRSTHNLLLLQKKRLIAIDCSGDTFYMIMIDVQEDHIDLRRETKISDLAKHCKITKGSKVFEDRNLAIWKHLQDGFVIDKQKTYSTLLHQFAQT